MSRTKKHEIGVGLLVIGAALLLGFMAIKVGAIGSLGERITVVAVFDDAAGLKQGAAVTVAGVEVGRVESLEVDFDTARVTLTVDPAAEIREDVVVAMRARSVLGEKYLEILPQSREAPLLQDGAVITETHGQYEIDQFVTGLEPLVQSLDPAEIDAMLQPLVTAMKEDPERPARMLNDLEATLANLREASEEAPALVREARATMAEVRATSSEARGAVARADAVLADVEEATAELPGTMERIPGLLDDAQATLADTRVAVRTLNDSSQSLAKVLSNFEDIDKWELRRLLREEGIVVRLSPSDVVPTE
ncbi:MAG TPA: MlaD family protein [Myxococcota bacterium]|nr:MlaD family protein [Myxococcota bacterium]